MAKLKPYYVSYEKGKVSAKDRYGDTQEYSLYAGKAVRASSPKHAVRKVSLGKRKRLRKTQVMLVDRLPKNRSEKFKILKIY